jgi:rare lipoprotein A
MDRPLAYRKYDPSRVCLENEIGTGLMGKADPAALRPKNVLSRGFLALIVACLGACSAVRQPLPPPIHATAPAPERPIFAQNGLASWYGAAHRGRLTANGERFDTEAMTAAHRTLSFGTVARVTNVATGTMIRVRINDRGPAVQGRVLDLSQNAARRLGIVTDGTADVRIEVFPSDQSKG